MSLLNTSESHEIPLGGSERSRRITNGTVSTVVGTSIGVLISRRAIYRRASTSESMIGEMVLSRESCWTNPGVVVMNPHPA